MKKKKFSLGLLIIGMSAIVVYGIRSLESSTHAEASSLTAVVYKRLGCECCAKWEDHLRENGFVVDSRPTKDLESIKAENGVPQHLAACHTALIDGYVIEGHVPASDIKKLLAAKPKNTIGLSVPGMPVGSPGMEGPYKENYDVVQFNSTGSQSVFQSH